MPNHFARVTIVDVPWVPSMGIHYLLAADGISLVLVLLTGLAAVAGVLFSWNIEQRTNEFFAFYLALIGGVYGVFLSFDLFLLFVFYEIAIVPKYFLISIWGSTRREYGAMKLALYSFVGSAMVLIGLLAAYATSGSHSTGLVELAHAGLPVSFQMWCFPLVFIGFAILAGMWPFHTWAPTGHVAAPTAASMLLAGVVMKLGAYGCLRVAMALFPHGMDPWGFSFIGIGSWRDVFAVLAVIGIVYGALVALAQSDFKFVIGYSSVSHMGFVLLGLMTLNQIGMTRRGAADVLARRSLRGCSSPLWAASCTSARTRGSWRTWKTMHLSKRLPFAAWAFVIAGMASMGLPGFSGFVAELQVLVGAWMAKPWWTVAAGVGIVVGVAYTWRALQKAFFSDRLPSAHVLEQEHGHELAAITWPEIAGVSMLVAASLVVGLYPKILLDAIEPAVKTLLAGGVTMNYADLFRVTLPETALEIAALLVLVVDLGFLRKAALNVRTAVAALLGVAGCGAALWTMLFQAQGGLSYPGSGELLLASGGSAAVAQVGILALTVLTLLLLIDSDFTRHVGEYVAVVLMAATGGLLIAAAQDLLVIFIGLELLSLGLYILTAFAKKLGQERRGGDEVLPVRRHVGGVSAVRVQLSVRDCGIDESAPDHAGDVWVRTGSGGALLYVALVMIAAGLGFKVAAVPFHLWAPDTYEGAPAPAAAFIASVSKVASFALLISIGTAALHVFGDAQAVGMSRASAVGPSPEHVRRLRIPWSLILAVLAVASMVLGNLAALAQIERAQLLAYSAIAHAGYILLGLAYFSYSSRSAEAILYYVLTYGLTTVGAFGVVAVVERATGSDRLDAFLGLHKRNPMLAAVLLVLFLSLAGIPPLVGFWAKFNLFAAVLGVSAGAAPFALVALAVAMSAVSLYYYLQVLKRAYVMPAVDETPIAVHPVTLAVLAVDCSWRWWRWDASRRCCRAGLRDSIRGCRAGVAGRE